MTRPENIVEAQLALEEALKAATEKFSFGNVQSCLEIARLCEVVRSFAFDRAGKFYDAETDNAS